MIVVGLSRSRLAQHFVACRLAARVDNRAGIDNDERGEQIEICRGARRPWSQMWTNLKHLG